MSDPSTEPVDEQPAKVLVPGPGIYNLAETDYHADPVPGGSLSSTGARKLLESCPAKYQHWRQQLEAPKAAWDEGSAAHKLVLGTGPELVRIAGDGKSGPDTWNTAAVKEQVAAARLAGQIPLKPRQWEQVHGMAEALQAHPLAAALLAPGVGAAEQTIVWQDEWTGVMCRALIDHLWHPVAAGAMFYVPDYKTAVSAHPDDVARSIADWGLHIQGWWYKQAVKAAGRAGPDTEFALVVQEKAEPYLVSVVIPDREALEAGGLRARDAINTYAECSASGVWPGYSPQGVPVSLPPWELAKAGVSQW